MWQDYAIVAIQSGFGLLLLPMLWDKNCKPNLVSAVGTSSLCFLFAIVLFTLRTYWGSAMTAAIGGIWTILAYQRLKQDKSR